MNEPKVKIRLTMGWSGLPRGTELKIASSKASDLIAQGKAERVGGYAAPHNAALGSRVCKG